jgi:hypothetical protein
VRLERFKNAVAAFRFGAGDGAATFYRSVGVSADESTVTRQTMPRRQRN